MPWIRSAPSSLDRCIALRQGLRRAGPEQHLEGITLLYSVIGTSWYNGSPVGRLASRQSSYLCPMKSTSTKLAPLGLVASAIVLSAYASHVTPERAEPISSRMDPVMRHQIGDLMHSVAFILESPKVRATGNIVPYLKAMQREDYEEFADYYRQHVDDPFYRQAMDDLSFAPRDRALTSDIAGEITVTGYGDHVVVALRDCPDDICYGKKTWVVSK